MFESPLKVATKRFAKLSLVICDILRSLLDLTSRKFTCFIKYKFFDIYTCLLRLYLQLSPYSTLSMSSPYLLLVLFVWGSTVFLRHPHKTSGSLVV